MPRLNNEMRAWLKRHAADGFGDYDTRKLARALLEIDEGEPVVSATNDVDRLRERALALKGQVASLERERDEALKAAQAEAQALAVEFENARALGVELPPIPAVHGAFVAMRTEVHRLGVELGRARQALVEDRANAASERAALQAALDNERAKTRANWNTYEHGRLYGMAIAAHKAERVMAQEAGPRAAGAEAVRDALFSDDAQARATVMRWQQAERDLETISSMIAERIPCKGSAIERVRMMLAALELRDKKEPKS